MTRIFHHRHTALPRSLMFTLLVAALCLLVLSTAAWSRVGATSHTRAAAGMPSGSGTSGRGDWWMFQHDPQHTGRSPFNGPTVPTIKWRSIITGSSVYSSAAIGGDGTLYFGSNDGNFYAVNPQDGSLKWTKPDAVGSATQWSSPAIAADGTIYVGSADMNLYAFNPLDGSLKWSYLTNTGITASPTVGTDGTIYIGSDVFYALNANGTLKWKSAAGSTRSSAAISADGATVYVGSLDGNLYAYNAATGSVSWKYKIPTSNIDSSPAVGSDGAIYFGSEDGWVYAINANGTLKWKYQTGGSRIWSSPALGTNGNVYIGSFDNNLYALSQTDGTVKWTFSTGTSPWTSPVIGADGTVYIGGLNLYALDPTNGTQKWNVAKTCYDASPAIGADGTIYIGSSDHSLYAIGSAAAPTLTLTKSASVTSATQGATYTYTLAYSNTGSASATNAWLSDTLPANIAYIPGSASAQVAVTNGSILTFNLGTLAPNQSGQVTFQVTVNANATVGSQISNTATIASTEVTTPVASNTAIVNVVASQRGDWWMIHHDAQHTGRSKFNGPSSNALKWKFQTRAAVRNAPAIASDGTIFLTAFDTGTSSGLTLFAFNPDGTKKWSYTNRGLSHFATAAGTPLLPEQQLSMKGTITVFPESGCYQQTA